MPFLTLISIELKIVRLADARLVLNLMHSANCNLPQNLCTGFPNYKDHLNNTINCANQSLTGKITNCSLDFHSASKQTYDGHIPGEFHFPQSSIGGKLVHFLRQNCSKGLATHLDLFDTRHRYLQCIPTAPDAKPYHKLTNLSYKQKVLYQVYNHVR